MTPHMTPLASEKDITVDSNIIQLLCFKSTSSNFHPVLNAVLWCLVNRINISNNILTSQNKIPAVYPMFLAVVQNYI